MRIIAWILLIFCSFEVLKALGSMFFGESAGKRFLSLFVLVAQAVAVYVAVTYLYFAHNPYRIAIIVAGAFNGLSALLALCQEEAVDRVFGFILKALYCAGFLLLL